MPYRIVRPDGAADDTPEFWKQKLAALKKPGELEAQLNRIDHFGKFQRIFVMGCGRSGTWLLLSVFSTFAETDLLVKEVEVAEFGTYVTDKPCLVLKRAHNSYQTIMDIPPQIDIAYIVRHPFAVLTSHNVNSGRKYHVGIDRWLGEMHALSQLVSGKGRPNLIVRYEDLVTDPEGTRQKISKRFNLSPVHAIEKIPELFSPPEHVASGMHGLRKIDTNSLNRYRQDPEKLADLKLMLPALGKTLAWVAETFDYDVSLPQ